MSNDFDDILGTDPEDPALITTAGHAVRITSAPFQTKEVAAQELLTLSLTPKYLFGYIDPDTLRVIAFFEDENPGYGSDAKFKEVIYVDSPTKDQRRNAGLPDEEDTE